MTQPIQPQNNPNKQVKIEDDDISLDAITTRVELRESGIAACYLTSNNEDGKLYLESLHLNDRVVVKLVPDSDPPTAINWAIVNSVFDGNIQELSPILSNSGQICQVVALGKGYQMKEMKVSKQYGFITPVMSWAYTNDFDDSIHEWNSTTGYHRGSLPYIHHYSGLPFPLGYAFLYICNEIHSELLTHVGSEIGAFTLGVLPEYDGGVFTTAELHIVGAMYSNGAGTAGNVVIKPYWTTDTGASPTWHVFSAGTFSGITSVITSSGVNNPVWETYPLIGTYHQNANYNPPIDYAHGTPVGNDLLINILPELPYWNPNFKIKLEIQGVSGTVQGGVTITLMYLKYQFSATSGKTVRELIAGANGTLGIVPTFVNYILGTDVSSGYSVIDTDYVVKDDITVLANLIPFIKFPYMDALTSIQEVIKYGSALKFLQSSGGYHWKVDTDGNLLVAFTNNHDVYGVDGSHLVSSKWVLSPYATPIKVKQEMVTQDFKQSIPLANYVLIAGQFHYPLNDNICQGASTGAYSISYWRFTGGVGTFGTRAVVAIASDDQTNGPCLEFQPVWDTLGVNVNNIYVFPMFDNPSLTKVDLTTLMGFNTVPKLSFWLRCGGGVSSVELRLYIPDSAVPANPLLQSFFSVTLNDLVGGTDVWTFIEVDLPNTKYLKDYGNWTILTDDILGLAPKSIDWINMQDIKFFGIRYNATSISGAPYVRIRGLSLNGTVIRGAYDSVNIAAYGCRMLTIKDSMASTDSLSEDDTTGTLTLEAIYELQRNRRVIITGEVSIPLDPTWQEGQQVWIQAEDYLPVGASYTSGATAPTINTVGTVGSYYIRTTNSEVYLCTVINGTGPYTYTWVDQAVVRYKIDKWFRITKVTHEFTEGAAMTRLQVTDDYYSSIPVNVADYYTVLIRSVNPDFQTKSMGSLKSGNDFDLGLSIISKDYTAYTY